MESRTLFQKLRDQHHIADLSGGESLRVAGRAVRNPELTYATNDHQPTHRRLRSHPSQVLERYVDRSLPTQREQSPR
jgi:hypothetical protein